MIPMKKLLNKKGFTLMEMLIVVAIIVVLVAISIPTFSGSLDKANAATDAANYRAAKAVVINAEMAGTPIADGSFYEYDSATFVTSSSNADTGKCSKHKAAYIGVVSGEATWVDSTGKAIADQTCN